MRTIEGIIHALDEKDKEWKGYFENARYFGILNNTSYMDDTKRLILCLMEEIIGKQKWMVDNQKDDEVIWNAVSNLVKSDLVVQRMREMNLEIIQPYRNLRLLRIIPSDLVITLIVKVFENLSINYSPDFFLTGEEYGVKETQEFTKALVQLDRIVSVHVSRHFDKNTAKKEFLKVTGVDETCGVVYSELYEKNMVKLQYNVCLDRLEELNIKMDQMVQEISAISEKIKLSDCDHNGVSLY